jgi:hypothetical protein
VGGFVRKTILINVFNASQNKTKAKTNKNMKWRCVYFLCISCRYNVSPLKEMMPEPFIVLSAIYIDDVLSLNNSKLQVIMLIVLWHWSSNKRYKCSGKMFVSNDHGYVSFVVIKIQSFPHPRVREFTPGIRTDQSYFLWLLYCLLFDLQHLVASLDSSDFLLYQTSVSDFISHQHVSLFEHFEAYHR